MIQFISKLYGYTSIMVGGYVCSKNIQNGKKMIDNKNMYNNDKQLYDKLDYVIKGNSIVRGIFYGFIFPYTIYEIKNESITLPLYYTHISCYGNKYEYEKLPTKQIFIAKTPTVNNKNSIKISGKIMYKGSSQMEYILIKKI